MARPQRSLLSVSLMLIGASGLMVGAAGLADGPEVARAAYRPFDNTLTDQDHHRNDILLPRTAPVTIQRPEVQAQAGTTTKVTLLAVNDFHGNLAPPSGSGGNIATAGGNVVSGGAEYLSTHIKNLKAANPNSIVVSAGDLIGASPFLSALFHDEPTIAAWNEIGLEFNAVGNHEFDEGSVELMRLQNGGCHPVDGCKFGTYAGAKFMFLGANVIDDTTGKPFLPPFAVKTVAGVKIGFVGVVTKTTPTIVSASGVKGLTFIDEADAVNKVIPQLKAQGVETIVVLVHEGGNVTGLYNECAGLTGPIAGIVSRLDPEVDVVISGHSHVGYNCAYTGRVLTQSASFGRLIGKIDLTIDTTTGEVASMAADNIIATRDVVKDGKITTIIQDYGAAAGPLGARPVGKVTGTVSAKALASGESPLGDLIADAQLASMAAADKGGAVMAFMNPGGIRGDLVALADGTVTYESAFLVQPFNNYLVTVTLTGAQIDTLLEQQWVDQNPPRILQVSKGFTYTWDGSKPDGQKVDPATIKLNGTTISPTAQYRVTVNNFLVDGGDKFVVLRDGKNRLFGELDIDALEKFLTANAPVGAITPNRISATNLPAATPTATAAAPTSPVATATARPTTPPLPPATGNADSTDKEMHAGLVAVSAALLLAGLATFLAGHRRRQSG